MCHPPLMTGMERIKVLSSLRLPEIVLPHSEHLTGKEVRLTIYQHFEYMIIVIFKNFRSHRFS